MIISAYFNSRHNYSRYYPFIKDIYNVFPPSYDIKKYNFFYKADLSHNPEKKVVWTDIYLDPAGQGWMISSIVPIYKDSILEGVTGFDVTIEKIIESLFEIKIPYNGSSFLINNNGEIIATTNKIDKILSTNNNQYKYKKNEKINGTILKEKVNILKHKNKELVSIVKNMLSKENYKHELIIDGKRYFIFTKYIEKTSWYIISLIKEEDVLKEVNELEDYYIGLGIFIISLIIIFYTIFFIYLYKKAQNFVRKINKPLLKIISLTKNVGKKKKLEKLASTGVTELDLLNENFNNMVKKLEERTKKLIEVEAKRELQEHLANIDALTGAYNRRFLSNFTESYLKIVKREKSIFSLMIVDIDDFKFVNDTYGHNVGDEILILLVDQMKDLLRENDIIVRFGGDEFIVLLPDTNQENTINVANKLLEKINEIRCPFKDEFIGVTVSIGTAEYNKNDENIESIIRRADESLYTSKHKGKNTVS
jgi:diguanylate cyclase (GGDEF)-like protein